MKRRVRWWLMVGLTVAMMACNVGDVGCKVTCSDVEDQAGCITKCEALLNSGETLNEALEVE